MTRDQSKQILSRIYGMGRGAVFSAKDFLDLASHSTVRQTLGRLTHEETIRRIMTGVYEYPAFSAILNAPASPDPNAIAQAIARAHGWTILPSGDTALNILGLSTQVPGQWQYFSDGPSKKYDWAGGRIAFRHRTNKEISIISPRTALLVQALKSLGENRIDNSVTTTILEKFSPRELSRAVREARYVTSWVYEIIKRLVPGKDVRNA